MDITSRRWKRTAAVSSVVVVAAVLVNAYLLDGVVGWFCTAIGAAPTEFAAEYSEQSFRRVKKGLTSEEVRRILGVPLYVVLTYSNGTELKFEGLSGKPYNGIGSLVSQVTKEVARSKFGDPRTEGWSYGRSPTTSPYRVRYIVFERERVVDVVHRLEW
jgi:hypothetical protein